ncbi:ATP-binding protein [Puia sp. P3]|uniref:ATP-binding protein n=1 Tax=Puia sp. P3 TaxID=3423952 RepID=UPI003D66F2E2
MEQRSLIDIKHFIIATRDSGYKSTASAIAEVIDNAIESGANAIQVHIKRSKSSSDDEYEIAVQDNGVGMTSDELHLALQFGGSTRFNSRRQLGRYGMGLPNSSLSQCKRLEVVTWQDPSVFIFNYLDVDEMVENGWTELRPSQSVATPPCQ